MARNVMEKILAPKRVGAKGQKKDLLNRWAKFNKGERDLGYVKRHKKYGGHGGRYSDPRAALAPEGSNRRLQDIAMLRMNQERKWAQQGMDRPAYMDFQAKILAEGRHKKLRKAREEQGKADRGKGGKRSRQWAAEAAKHRRKAGVGVDPAAIREQALQGRAGQQLRARAAAAPDQRLAKRMALAERARRA